MLGRNPRPHGAHRRLLDAVPTTWDDFALSGRGIVHLSSSSTHPFASRRPPRTDGPFEAHLVPPGRSAMRLKPDAAEWLTPDGRVLRQGPGGGGLGRLFRARGRRLCSAIWHALTFPEMLTSLTTANPRPPTPHRRDLSAPRFRRGRRHEKNIRRPSLHAPGSSPPSGPSNSAFAEFASAFRPTQRPAIASANCLLRAAGRIAPSDVHTLAHLRGLLMAESRDGVSRADDGRDRRRGDG